MRADPKFHALSAALQQARMKESGDFPASGFRLLAEHGLTTAPLLADGDIGALLRLLATVGRGDLSVGRIYEGHVNARLLIRSHGTAEQQAHYAAEAANGALFGVWNTDQPDAPLRLEDGVLRGAKNFASGVDGLRHALVTVSPAEGRRMIVVPVERLSVDRSWWRPMGMRASGSHIASFEGVTVDTNWFLGHADAYVREPWFSGGAIRFAAVQTGGMHAIFDIAVAHLRRTQRDGDPYQRQRLARMGIATEAAYGWLDRAAEAWKEASAGADGGANERLIAVAAATRSAVEMAAMEVLTEAERAVGAAGFNAPHPLERWIRDLRTYLRQPNPDGALAALGDAIAQDAWQPGQRP